jgi:hypothetical protein
MDPLSSGTFGILDMNPSYCLPKQNKLHNSFLSKLHNFLKNPRYFSFITLTHHHGTNLKRSGEKFIKLPPPEGCDKFSKARK